MYLSVFYFIQSLDNQVSLDRVSTRKRVAMTHPHYDNILMLNSVGMPLARIARRKADWFVKKNLAREYLLREEKEEGHLILVLQKLPKQIPLSMLSETSVCRRLNSSLLFLI